MGEYKGEWETREYVYEPITPARLVEQSKQYQTKDSFVFATQFWYYPDKWQTKDYPVGVGVIYVKKKKKLPKGVKIELINGEKVDENGDRA